MVVIFLFVRLIKFVYVKFDGRSLEVFDTVVFVIVNLCVMLGAEFLIVFIMFMSNYATCLQ
jgi:hypothetical protein